MLNQTDVTNERAERGLILAIHAHVHKIEPRTTAAQLYKVDSESKPNEQYSVIKKSDGDFLCDCQDFQRRARTCKHIYATLWLEYFRTVRELDKQGVNVVERIIQINQEPRHERIDISGGEFNP